jgi:uncharacterized protein (TIGR00255 family)
MALASMTGFARASGQFGPFRWAWELKSVNGKSLDMRLRLPPLLDPLDPLLRGLISRRLSRGNIQAGLELARDAVPSQVRVNLPLLQQLAAELDRIAAGLGKPPPGVDALLGVRGMVEVIEPADDEEQLLALREQVAASFVEALDALAAMRAREGTALGLLLGDRLGQLAALVATARALPGRSAAAVHERLSAQLATLLAGRDGLDPGRLHQEAALLAVKADVQEELDRLDAHVASARAMLAEEAPVGRRLDFLCQELNREANTLCAKSGDVGLTTIGLGMKTLIEQFREQVQNVE